MQIVYTEISSAHDHDELDNERKMTLSFQIPVSQWTVERNCSFLPDQINCMVSTT